MTDQGPAFNSSHYLYQQQQHHHHREVDLTPTPFHHTGSAYQRTSPPPPWVRDGRWRVPAGFSPQHHPQQRYHGHGLGPQLLGHEKATRTPTPPRSVEEAVGSLGQLSQSQSILQEQELARTLSQHSHRQFQHALSSSPIGQGYDERRPHSQHTISSHHSQSHHTLSSSPAPAGSEYQNERHGSSSAAEYTHRPPAPVFNSSTTTTTTTTWHWDARPDLELPAPPYPVPWLPPPNPSSPVGWTYQPPAPLPLRAVPYVPPPPNSPDRAVRVDGLASPVPEQIAQEPPMVYSYRGNGMPAPAPDPAAAAAEEWAPHPASGGAINSGGYQLPVLGGRGPRNGSREEQRQGQGQGIFLAPIVLGNGQEQSVVGPGVNANVGGEEQGHESSVTAEDAQMQLGLEVPDEGVVYVAGKVGSTGATPAPVDVSNMVVGTVDPAAMILTDAVLGLHAGSPKRSGGGGFMMGSAFGGEIDVGITPLDMTAVRAICPLPAPPRKSRKKETINETPKQAGIQQTPSITSGPLPAESVKVTEDANGNMLLSFTYSLQRHKTLYTILTDLSSCPPPSQLSEVFKKDNCVYPKAVVSNESEYKGVRWRYETECNRLAWGLCWINPCLRGRRGLIQRAVDSWRNKEPGMRSRRIKKAAKRMADDAFVEEVGQLKNPKKSKVVTELTKIPVLGEDVDELGLWEAQAAGVPEREVEMDVDLADGGEEAEVLNPFMKTVHKKTGPKYLLMADPLRLGARVRVKVLVSHVNLVAIPDDFRRKHCLFPSTFGMNRDDLDEAQQADYDRKMMFNELGWRLAWANIRVFADRPLYLARAVDMWRRRLVEVRQDPTEDIERKFEDWLKLGPPRTAKEEFFRRRRQVQSEGEDEVR